MKIFHIILHHTCHKLCVLTLRIMENCLEQRLWVQRKMFYVSFQGKCEKTIDNLRRYFISNSSSSSSQSSEQFTSAHTRDTTYSISNISKNNSILQFMNKTFLKQGHLETQNVLTKQVDENLGQIFGKKIPEHFTSKRASIWN